MFIEKLKKEDLKKFEFDGFYPTKVKKLDDRVILEFANGICQYLATDFEVKEIKFIESQEKSNFSNAWHEFMTNTFGEEYSCAYKQYLEETELER